MGRVAKKARRADSPMPVLESTLDPLILRGIETLCRDALAYGGNHPAIRSTVNDLVQRMRVAANVKFGSDTLDILAILNVLRKTDPSPKEVRRYGRIDPILDLVNTGRLREEHSTAAGMLRDVWNAFGRFLTIAGRSMEGGGGKRSRILSPMDVMDQDTYELWNDLFVPWHTRSKNFLLFGRRQTVTATSLVFGVLMEDYRPPELDRAYGFPEDITLLVLRQELVKFGDPLSDLPADPRLESVTKSTRALAQPVPATLKAPAPPAPSPPSLSVVREAGPPAVHPFPNAHEAG